MRFFILYVFLFFGTVSSIRAQSPDPFSPTVTRSEAALLSEAMRMEDPAAAIALLKKEESKGMPAALAFSLGNLYFQTEQYPGAVAAYKDALEKFPNFRNAKINLGRVYLIQENRPEAIRLYQELVRDGVADGETYFWLGQALMLEGQVVSAESAYRQCLLLDQNRTEAKQGLLNCLMMQKRDREALALATELIQGDVSQRAFWAGRVNAQLSLADTAGALQSLEQVWRLGVADGEMLAMAGELYMMQGLFKEAVLRFEEAFAMGELPLRRHGQAVRGMLEAGELEAAEAALLVMVSEVKIRPEAERSELEGWILNLQSQLLMRQGKTAEAEILLRHRLESDPLNGEVLGVLAELEREQGQLEAAMLLRERQARVSGFEAEALLGMGQIEVQRENWAQAIALMERAQVFEETPQVARYLQQLRRMNDE